MSVRKLLFLGLLILSSCSVSKKKFTPAAAVRVPEGTSMADMLTAANITSRDFDIVKADIEVFSNGSGRRLLASVKHRKPGEYLISLRHRTGIEAARIFINRDTIMVNDRIYRNLYIGSNDWLIERYGIGTMLIPLVFGDYLASMSDAVTLSDCRSGVSEIQGYIGDRELWYYIDCNSAKVSSVTVSDISGRNPVKLSFGSFKRSGNYFYPGKISIVDMTGSNRISIEIASVEFRDSGKIEFIPGNNYEKIILK